MINKSFNVRHATNAEYGLGKVVGGTIVQTVVEEKLVHVPQVMVLWENVRTPSPSFHTPEELAWEYIDGDMPTALDAAKFLMELRDSEDEFESLDDVIIKLGAKFDFDIDLNTDEESDEVVVEDVDEE
jgi:hypothetical protein